MLLLRLKINQQLIQIHHTEESSYNCLNKYGYFLIHCLTSKTTEIIKIRTIKIA